MRSNSSYSCYLENIAKYSKIRGGGRYISEKQFGISCGALFRKARASFKCVLNLYVLRAPHTIALYKRMFRICCCLHHIKKPNRSIIPY